MSNVLFETNPTNLDITRSKFKRPSNLKTTFNMGKLIPIYIDEVLPGDTKKMYNRKLLRMNTPIKPLMDSLVAQVYWFFVPNRIIYDNWEELQGANKSGPWSQQVQYSIPQTSAPSSTGWASGSLADYMGLPVGKAGYSVSSLPFRAYCQIWNDWFRDENLQDFAYINKGSSNTTGTNNSSNYVTDPITGGMLLPVSKLHDYFTSALPEPQKGPDVLLPLGNTAPVIGNGTGIGFTNGTENSTLYSTGSNNLSEAKNKYGSAVGSAIGTATHSSTAVVMGITTDGTKSGMVADLRNATAATINNLRQAFAVQRMYERDARGGTRYIEILKSHFGVTSSDARLQRPEYLNGKTIPVNIQQVNQTSSTDSTSPQGNTAAYSLTGDEEYAFTKSFEEHGILMGLICVRQDHSYSQGIEKFWLRKTRTDFYMPVFANLSEQPILNKEIYTQGSSVVDTNGNIIDDQVFGYQEAWADYRYKPSKLTGLMRPNATGNVAIWNLGDNFASLPTLGADFIAETKGNLDRCLAVSSATSGYQFILDCYFEPTETRPMPIRSIPGLIDHH